MAKKVQETEQGSDLLENQEALAAQFSKTEEYLEQNKGVTFGLLAVILLGIGGYFGYKYYNDNQNAAAMSEMFQAEYYFERDSLDLALNGDGNSLGFKDIISDYSGTASANLAHYYAGVVFLKQGDFNSAILYLEDFSTSDLLVQARAYSLIGDAYMEQEDYANAVSFYNKAADYNENKFFSPGYLMKAALASELMDDKAGAIKSYDRIVKDYWNAGEVQDAKKHKARLEGASS
jgi:predicted negative regulator of RcsB-dependent stress response